MRFGTKLLAAIERGEWVRIRSWYNGLKIRNGDEGHFVDGTGCDVTLEAAEVLSNDWVIVRKKRKAPVADGRRYEPIETMPIVGDRIEHPDNAGKADAESLRHTVKEILEAEATHRWRVEADSAACSLDKSGYGWRILKRRNVFTDPKPGDVVGRAGATVEVRFVETGVVLLLLRWNSGQHTATSRESWAAYAASGWTVRKLGS
ncbi:MAG: hypothetical protein BroJett007_33830 [Chloroflexota bacterium]|nr:MAG: hypothetical protein BroJett007_33830 [Chloroflexota bacterium]